MFEIRLINVINNRLERIIVPSVITCQYFALFCLQNSSKQTEIALTFYNGQLSEGLGTSAGKLRSCADKLIKKLKSFFLSFNVRLLSLSALVWVLSVTDYTTTPRQRDYKNRFNDNKYIAPADLDNLMSRILLELNVCRTTLSSLYFVALVSWFDSSIWVLRPNAQKY